MKQILGYLVGMSALVLLAACDPDAPKAPQSRPLQPIDVAQVVVQDVQAWHTYTTRLQAPEQVDLMPRVSGVIETVHFQAGQRVAQGDVLFTLDARPFAAQVERLEAQLASAKAALSQANSESKRAQRLLKQNAIAKEQADLRQATFLQRQADVAAITASLKAAQLDLGFTQVIAPINGVLSHTDFTAGDSVLQAQSVLTTLVSDEHMHAYFDVDERTWYQAFAGDALGKPVLLQGANTSANGVLGKVDFVDNQINPQTGTLRLRAVFDGKAHGLKAGAFARVKLAEHQAQARIIVPSRAIGTDLNNRFVLVLTDENTLAYRKVTVGKRYGQFNVILSGLNAEDVLAVNGPARVGPGMPVAPNYVALDTSHVAFTLTTSPAQLTAQN